MSMAGLNKYEVESITPAGGGWYHVRITGPMQTSVLLRRFNVEGEQTIREKSEEWCNRVNKQTGLAERPSRGEALARYKAVASTIIHGGKL